MKRQCIKGCSFRYELSEVSVDDPVSSPSSTSIAKCECITGGGLGGLGRFGGPVPKGLPRLGAPPRPAMPRAERLGLCVNDDAGVGTDRTSGSEEEREEEEPGDLSNNLAVDESRSLEGTRDCDLFAGE